VGRIQNPPLQGDILPSSFFFPFAKMRSMAAAAESAIHRIIIGTAGHIDHGKSAIVRRLTGIDPDRLPEEKERGLTIDLGFAPFVLRDGRRVGIIDVPGHERFIKNMVAGATSLDLVMLVVTAIGIMVPAAPGYVGTLNIACTAGLAPYHVSGAPASAFGWFYFFSQWLPITAVGLFFLNREGLSLRSLGHVQDEAA